MSDPAHTLSVAEQAQSLASQPDTSVWVSANAGSGKTHILINRVIRLLLSGTDPGRILCLTFTRAAAAEMASRLYQRLGEWAVMPDSALAVEVETLEGHAPDEQLIKKARLLFAQAIETPGGLKIQTIHAFCERLLGRFPLEAGVPAHFRMVEEGESMALMAQARTSVLRAIESGQPGSPSGLSRALAFVSTQAGEFGFERLFTAIVSDWRKIRHCIDAAGDVDAAIRAMHLAIGLAPGETEEGLLQQGCEAVPQEWLEKAQAVLESGTTNDVKQAERLRRFRDLPPGAGAFAACSEIFLSQKGEPRKTLLTKKLADQNPALLEVFSAAQARISGIRERLKVVRMGTATAAMLHLADRLLSSYDAIKRRHGVLDYDDLITKACALLTRTAQASWVLYKLDGGLDHILVDEAQDTSPEQWEVIAALADEFFSGRGARERTRTIFAVGDEKQSIYTFQGADPARFSQMREYFSGRVRAARQKWQPVSLLLSFRSVPEILGAVDRVFQNEEAAKGLSTSEDPVAHYAHRIAHSGLVEIWETEKPEDEEPQTPWDAPLDYPRPGNPQQRLAHRIADRIGHWLETGERLEATGKPVTPGDILVLVRRRNSFVDTLIRVLKRKGVAVAGVDRVALGEQLAVMDLVALGRFVLLPDDDLTLATVLKGPFAGFDEETLFDLAHNRSGSLWATLTRRREETEAFSQAYQTLSRLLSRDGPVRPSGFYADILCRQQGRKALLTWLGPDAADPIDEFFSRALEYERQNAGSLQGFLHAMETGETMIKREMDHGRNEVRVATVHGAKGLEAPIVFLPDTCAALSAQHDSFLLFPEKDGQKVPLWPMKKENDETLASEARETMRAAQMDEYRRLFYVAMTRARDRLYISGYETKKGRARGCWYDLVEKALLPHARSFEEAGKTVWRIGGPDAGAVQAGTTTRAMPSPDEGAVSQPASAPLPDWAQRPAPPVLPLSRPLAPSRLQEHSGGSPDEDGLPAPFSPREGSQTHRFRRGRLIHRLLQSLPDLPRSRREAAAREYLAGRSHNLGREEQEEIREATFAVLENPAFEAFFGPEGRAEVPLAGCFSGKNAPLVLSGQVDRLLVSHKDVWVIDYKTNRPPPAHPDQVAPAYMMQMAAYHAVLNRIYPCKTVHCGLLWTEGPTLMLLSPERLKAFGEFDSGVNVA